MKILVGAAATATCIAVWGMSGASAAPATDATARAAARLSPQPQFVRLERRHEAPRHRRHTAVAMQTATPNKPQPGQIYQDGSYTYRIGADGRRWYEPTICNCGPQ